MAPVPVTKLVCDGNTYKCTANLVSSRPLLDWFDFFNWYRHCLSSRFGAMGTGWHSGTPPSSIRASSKFRMFEPNKSKCTHRASSVFVMYDELCQMYNSFETVLNMRLFLHGIFVGQAMQVEKNYLGRQFIVAINQQTRGRLQSAGRRLRHNACATLVANYRLLKKILLVNSLEIL